MSLDESLKYDHSDFELHLLQPIRSTTQIVHHQYGISAFISQMSFHGETSGGVAKGGCFLRPCGCNCS